MIKDFLVKLGQGGGDSRARGAVMRGFQVGAKPCSLSGVMEGARASGQP